LVIKKRFYLVVSIQITELFFQVDVEEMLNFGMLKDNVSIPSMKTTIQIGSVKSDIHHQTKLYSLPQLVGMEDLKFGVHNSKFYIHSKLMKNKLMLYLSLL
jgi:hypothetical protein